MRYQFPVYLTTDVIMMIESDTIDGVDVGGEIQDLNGDPIHTYEDNIRG